LRANELRTDVIRIRTGNILFIKTGSIGESANALCVASIEPINSKNIDVSLFITPNTASVKTCNTIMIDSKVFAVCSLFALKVAQGGLYKTVFFHIALLGVLGSITAYAMNELLAGFLEESILDIGAVT